ncbi:MAG: InlB B-repeat-containing protein, partial [Clostridia bacterium]|nr:InlB B-repeat-containing protein [Clostridia bacterium]
KPFNKVTFVDDLTGDVISVQDVYEGEDATVPEAPEHEGYTFSHWNNSSSNINGDLEIRAVYDKNVYTVVWIDYVQEKYEMETYEHGADLIPPYGLIESSEYVPAGWEGYIPDTHIPITSNMVIAAQYDYRTFTVDFLDFNGDVIESQTIKYGETPEFPEFDYGNVENTIFFGFGCIEEYLENAGSDELETNSVSVEANETQIGTSTEEEESEFIMLEDYKVYNNCQIVPKFEFAETTATPTIDISTGTYSEAKTVTIECETESALIFYTLDGSDPATSETAIECASPAVITIEDSCQLRYYASAFNMNASDECREWYAINDGDETNKYIVKFAAYDEDTVGYTGIAEKDSKLNAELISAIEGYTFIGAYSSVDVSIDEEMGEVTDAAYSDEWNFATDTVTGDTTLYLKYDINTYTVDFIDYDGFYLDSQTVEYGESAVAPEVPARDGYVFTGWDTDEYLTVTDNMEVNAVYVPEDEYVTVSLSKSNYTMMSGNSFKLNATTGGNVENPAIAWVSTDENVAVVDDSGTVTATDKGTVEIYAIVVDNGETAKCTITIVGNPSDELCLTGSSYLTVSENYVLGFDITTENDNHHAEMVAEIKTHFSSANLVFTNINGEELADTDYVGTGTQIILMDGETIVDTLTAVVSGDMDGDGYVTNRDAARVNRYLVDKENPTEDQLYAMDVNADGYVNNRDASLVSRFLVGKEKI